MGILLFLLARENVEYALLSFSGAVHLSFPLVVFNMKGGAKEKKKGKGKGRGNGSLCFFFFFYVGG